MEQQSSARLQLTLGTGAFTLCFAVFGSQAAMMPILSRQLHLTPAEQSIAIAMPVLLGSLARIPVGIFTDRWGGRRVFLAVMGLTLLAAFLMGEVGDYAHLLLYGFLVGMGLASFSVGVGLVSDWYAPKRQGLVLGVYGAGNIGQSLAAFGAPVIAGAWGFRWGFWSFGVVLAVWLAIFAFAGRNAPRQRAARSFAEAIRPLGKASSWVLSLYYSLTFGGFVAMALYLPILLTDIFHLTQAEAAMRTAGFVVLATLLRPVGGALADRVGGFAILQWVFPLVGVMAMFLTWHILAVFTIGALSVAAAVGLGNGAVFKLVAEFFPDSVGSVSGLVGAAGGLGGLLPSLILGIVKWQTGSYVPGFILLCAYSFFCLIVLLYRQGLQVVSEAAR